MTRSYRILAIDDDPAMRCLFPIAFRRLPVELRIAAGESEAKELLAEAAPDLLLVDFHLENVNGIDVAERLSQELPASVPILMVTAENGDALHSYVAAGKCSAFLNKPICLSTFGAEVLQHLQPEHNRGDRRSPIQTPSPALRALGFLDKLVSTVRDFEGLDDSALFASQSLARAAHRWIGVSGIDGVPEIEAEARSIESIARSGDQAQASTVRRLLAEIIVKSEFAVAGLSALPDSVV